MLVSFRHHRAPAAVVDSQAHQNRVAYATRPRMFITQPTLSQQIRQLEKMVGTPLLQRHRKGVRLTEAGTVLLEQSRTVLPPQ